MSRILERCANERMKTIFRRRRIEKFFGAAVFQKCCRGVGEEPTFAKQIEFCSWFFQLQLQVLKLANRNWIIFMKEVTNSGKATGQLQHAGRQKQGWNPLLPDVEDRFSYEHSFPTHTAQTKKFFSAAVFQKCCRGVGE